MSTFRIFVNEDELKHVRKVLTEERLRLISVIKEKNPESIYELARILGRNRSSVMRDLRHLKKLGLVEFQNLGKRKKPVVNYEKISIVIPI